MVSTVAQDEPNLLASTRAPVDPLLTLGAPITSSSTADAPSASQVVSDSDLSASVGETSAPRSVSSPSAPAPPASERVVESSTSSSAVTHPSAIPSSTTSNANTDSTLTQNVPASSQSAAKKVSEPVSPPVSTPSPNASAPKPSTTTPTPAKPTPTKPPVASTSKSTPSPKANAQKKKKKSLFATIFPCFGDSSSHDDVKEPKPKPKTARPVSSVAGGGEKESITPVQTASSSPAAAVVTPSTNAKTLQPVVEEKKETPVSPAVEEISLSGEQDKGRDLAQTRVTSKGSSSRQAEALRVDTLVAALPLTGNDREVIIPSHEPTTPPMDETAGLTSSSVVPPGSGSHLLPHTPPSPSHHHTTSSNTPAESHAGDSENEHRYEGEHGTEGERSEEEEEELEEEEEEDEFSLLGGVGIPIGPDGQPCPLLPPMAPHHKGRKCLVLDLDETLLHSSFKMIPQSDFIVPVEIESQTHNVYVIKRPGVDEFMRRMGEIYEVVIFTASLSKYADPVLDMLDIHGVVAHRLFRESCYNHKGNYVKDLSQLGRPIDETIIIDNSPASYIFHPNNAVPVSTWFNDPHDAELSDLINFLADLAEVEDVRGVLDGGLM